MYIDFDPEKLGEEIKEETYRKLSGQGIAPGGCVDPSEGKDGGGGTVSDPGIANGKFYVCYDPAGHGCE